MDVRADDWCAVSIRPLLGSWHHYPWSSNSVAAGLRISRKLRRATVMLVPYFFFFSSRRRHTRCLSDWNSDVCSSDLFFSITITSFFVGLRLRQTFPPEGESCGALAFFASSGVRSTSSILETFSPAPLDCIIL